MPKFTVKLLKDLFRSNETQNRIAPVDGLRAVAVLGVIWVHWAFGCGTPVWSLGKISSVNLDVNRAISAIGTGVDLFFVISGCMYLMYAQKQTKFAWNTSATFLKKRWLRIAPNFYLAALVCAVGFLLVGKPFPWFDLLAHASFTQTLLPHTGTLAAPFWSLATPKVRSKSSESAYWLRSFPHNSYFLFSACLPFFRSSLFPL